MGREVVPGAEGLGIEVCVMADFAGELVESGATAVLLLGGAL